MHNLVLIGLLWVGCTKPVDPPEVRTPRNFTWIRDTLGNGSFQSTLSGIWGSSPNNVYAVGHSSSLWDGKIWRFNGSQWMDITYVYPHAFQEYEGYYFSPEQVIGFGPNDVWIVGERDTTILPQPDRKGFILRYGGSDPWTGYWLPTAKRHLSIGGVSSSDLWVGGDRGQMFHFNGTDWTEHSLNDSINIIFIKALSTNHVVVSGWPNGLDIVRYYQWNGSQWSLIESRGAPTFTPEAGISFDFLDGQIISANGPYVSRRVSSGVWQSIFYLQGVNFLDVGVGSGHLFALGMMINGVEAAFHYDGSGWARIESLQSPNTFIGRSWSFQTETFLLAKELQPNGAMFERMFVIRGK